MFEKTLLVTKLCICLNPCILTLNYILLDLKTGVEVFRTSTKLLSNIENYKSLTNASRLDMVRAQ